MKSLGMNLEFTEEQLAYFEQKAGKRGLSRTRLVHRLLRKIADDDLALAVLDDNEKPDRMIEGEKRMSRIRRTNNPPVRMKHRTPAQPPAYEPKSWGKEGSGSFRLAPTKRDLEQELHQAVLNTGGSELTAPAEEFVHDEEPSVDG